MFNGSFPSANVFLDEGLETPVTHECTFQAGTRLGQRGEIKAIFTDRSTDNFLDDFITLDPGRTTVVEDGRTFGTFDNAYIRNTDVPHRNYQALQLQSQLPLHRQLVMWAHYTHQLKNEGNFEGEAANQPGNYSIFGNQPEIYTESATSRAGGSTSSRRTRCGLFTTYDLKLGGAGTVNLGLLYRYDSPLTYSLPANNAHHRAQQRPEPGLRRQPDHAEALLRERGSASSSAQSLFDLALNYDIPVFKTVRPYFKFDMRNMFNEQPLIGFDTTVTPNNAGPRDSMGIPTEFIQASTYGTPQNNYTATEPHVPQPRTFLFAVGIRF